LPVNEEEGRWRWEGRSRRRRCDGGQTITLRVEVRRKTKK
jgi:hypothetical protein